jgi:hypothetical protein
LLTAAVVQSPSAAAEPVVSLRSLLRELTDLESLTRFPSPEYRLFQASSRAASPAGVVDLAAFSATEPLVLLDKPGPGALVRLWCRPLGGARGWADVFIDGVAAARFPVERPEGEPSGEAGPPYVLWADGSLCVYLPMPYQSHCRVVFEPEGEQGAGQLAFQATARAYRAGTAVESYAPQAVQSAREDLERGAKALSAGAAEAAEEWDTRVPIALSSNSPAAEVQVPRRRGGMVAELRLTPSTKDEDSLRATILTISFDGRTTVRAPLGDFFGTGPGLSPTSSRMTAITPEGELVSHWPMPFVERVKFALEGPGSPDVRPAPRKRPNLGPLNLLRRREEHRRKRRAPDGMVSPPDDVWVEGAVRIRAYAWDGRSMYFHSTWTRSDESEAASGEWEAASLSGRGVYVGGTLNAANPAPDWWGDGFETVWVDSEERPSLVGTGAADDFGLAGGSKSIVSAAFFGRTRADGPKHFGHASQYRWRILDRIPYWTSLRVHRGAASTNGLVLSAVNYWYADPSHTGDAPRIAESSARVPVLPEREVPRIAGAIEGESLAPLEVDGDPPRDESMVDYEESGPWSGDAHLAWRGGGPGHALVLGFDAPAPGRYAVSVYLSKSPDSGIHRLSINDESAGNVVDLYEARPARIGPIELGVFDLERTGNRLGVEVVSSSRLASPKHCAFGLDCLVLTPVK